MKPLKRAMRQTFRRLTEAVRSQCLPERRDISEFAVQVEVMVSYPGVSDPRNLWLQGLCAELAAGRAAADLPRCAETLASVAGLMRRCHHERL